MDFVVKLIMISFRNQFYPYGEFEQYPRHPPGWIYLYMLNDRGNVNHSPSASVTNAESLPESSLQYIENSSSASSSSTSSHPTSLAREQEGIDGVRIKKSCKFNCGPKNTTSCRVENQGTSQHGVFCSQVRL